MSYEFKIDKNLPFRGKKKAPQIPLEKMEVGDSIFIPANVIATQATIFKQTKAFSRATGATFSITTTGEEQAGHRVWRRS